MQINNEISEDICSLKLSKKLKEFGFGIKTNSYSYEDNEKVYSTSIVFDWNDEYSSKTVETCSRPTHSIVLKWLRDNFRIYIMVNENINFDNCYFYMINTMKVDEKTIVSDNIPTYYEATDNAILYCLNNLL